MASLSFRKLQEDLPVLNRRQFLVSAAVLLASLSGCTAFKPKVPQAEEPLPAEEEEGPRPFRIALLSDPHTVAVSSSLAGAVNGKLSDAIADYKVLRPDLWLVNGDLTDRGLPGEWSALKKIMGTVAQPERLLVNTGNHEFYDPDATDQEALDRFMQAFGLPTPYTSRVAGGVHIVMLADERYKTAPGSREWAWLTPEQVAWFERVLAEHREKDTIVCLHQPLQDTVIWSHSGNSFAGCGQVKELRAILEQNPQVRLWFSGHTHMGAEIPGNAVKQGGVTYVGLGSTFYQFVKSYAAEDQGGWPSYGGFKKDLSANQSRMLEVWPDRLVVRARDHLRHTWMEEHQLVLSRS